MANLMQKKEGGNPCRLLSPLPGFWGDQWPIMTGSVIE
jgi:hypothetical protein